MHFYNDVLVELCKEKNLKPTRAVINMGLSKSLVTKWAKTGCIPSDGSLVAISSYFHVDFAALKEGRIEYLDEKKPTAQGDGLMDQKNINLVNWFRSLPPENQKAILTLQGAPEGIL